MANSLFVKNDEDTTSDVWLTPPEILYPLGDFDLDPCAAVGQPWRTADRQMTKEDNGLSHDWEGRVWLNPPYSNIGPFMKKDGKARKRNCINILTNRYRLFS